jgi:polysaccharide pyruvyl transferase WcaK-like protein
MEAARTVLSDVGDRPADVVVTTRLHGLVLALKQGVPVLAVDPVAGGARVATQAAAWGWPVLLPRSGNPVLDHP